MKRNNKDLIKDWIEIADHDLALAKIALLHLPEYKDMICYHCQQAIEKYLKAYLIFLDIKFKYLHDLIYLLDLIDQKDSFPSELETMASHIQNISIDIRYPGSEVKLEEFNVKEAIETAEKFREIILKKLDIKT